MQGNNPETANTPVVVGSPGKIKMIPVPAHQLDELVAQNKELKADIGQLVGLLESFSTLFSGNKGGIMSLVPTITKLMNDKVRLEQMSAITPIIHKYTQTPQLNGENA